jgi:putative ABC transport system substrate-binding protein
MGGLLTYAGSLADRYSEAAAFIDKILKGRKPADLPVQQPMRFELVVNLKTAKAIGVTIPDTVMIRATDVLE